MREVDKSSSLRVRIHFNWQAANIKCTSASHIASHSSEKHFYIPWVIGLCTTAAVLACHITALSVDGIKYDSAPAVPWILVTRL